MQLQTTATKTKSMIDDLKTICTNYGLGNASSEYKIITEVFLYKFLNDKFFHEARRLRPLIASSDDAEAALTAMPDDDYDMLLMELGASSARFKKTHYISYLFNQKNTEDFHTLFDDNLVDLANLNIDVFSVKAGSEGKIRLFEPLSQHVIETVKKANFCRAIIDKLANFSFESAGVFNQKYDFFATIFEYLIKDYNKDFGKYAEYYTPHSIAQIIAKIMVPEGAQDVSVYDPAAGSGTLVLALAHEIGEENCTIFTQDISQKSNEFLRLNLILNNLVHSLNHVVHDDTLLTPKHLNRQRNGLKKFDYIVSNPPFNMDFSENRETLAGEAYKKRFFSGVPNIPPKKKESMAIYLLFLQHIVSSLEDNGKAAVVVPTGFLTAGTSIPKKIRKHLIDNKMLQGVVSMPSNIFATTGTNVSILFIDKTNSDDDIFLVDASNLGAKIKEDGKNQKTVLSDNEIEKIITTCVNKASEDDFSITVSYDDIKAKKYSFSAGQYFEIKIEYVDLTEEEFVSKMKEHKSMLIDKFGKARELEDEIIRMLGEYK